MLLLPRSGEPRWSAEAYRLMEEHTRALTSRHHKVAAESESMAGDGLSSNGSSSSSHSGTRTLATELHALNRDLTSAASALNEPVTFDFLTPESSISSSALANDPSDDETPHAARLRLIAQQARRLRRLVTALFPDAADFIVAAREPFDFDAVAAHAKLRLEAAYRHSIELSEAGHPTLALPIAAHWLGMEIGLPAKRRSPTAVIPIGEGDKEAEDDGGILPSFFYATYRSAQELVHVSVLGMPQRF